MITTVLEVVVTLTNWLGDYNRFGGGCTLMNWLGDYNRPF